jgi:DNA-binding Xre family transcriptional regulator
MPRSTKKNEPINCIKVVLAQKQVTSKKLAQMVGVTENTISRICRNESQPRLLLLKKIALALDVNIKDLLNDTK